MENYPKDVPGFGNLESRRNAFTKVQNNFPTSAILTKALAVHSEKDIS